jgi:hypothetical protein
MNGETISRGQLLLQYYSALAELEEEGRLQASHAAKAAGQSVVHRERIRQPIVLHNMVQATA